MTVSILDLHCLNAVTDDHESLASILEEVRRTSHGNVSRQEVVASLEEMTAAGLVAAYALEPHGSGTRSERCASGRRPGWLRPRKVSP